MWYNVSTWRMRAQAKDEAGGTSAALLTGPGRKAKGGFRECGMIDVYKRQEWLIVGGAVCNAPDARTAAAGIRAAMEGKGL